ncbi:MAG: tRNA uridine-5-carboxymethylaminomethyl(34) synthesis enzyme MnmG, partial [Faecalibacterium sp.]|nr:tRNA uridine-5-carboxymethylaminomethyl(34) synthesis enzyme MnmG [Faecalibacterium sp.]
EGYLQKAENAIKEQKRLEEKLLPPDIDYQSLSGLRLEARQKLSDVRPLSVAQAARISGVSPADVAVLLVYLSREHK